MPDEMKPNDPRNLWQGQEVEKVIMTIDSPKPQNPIINFNYEGK